MNYVKVSSIWMLFENLAIARKSCEDLLENIICVAESILSWMFPVLVIFCAQEILLRPTVNDSYTKSI